MLRQEKICKLKHRGKNKNKNYRKKRKEYMGHSEKISYSDRIFKKERRQFNRELIKDINICI